MKNILVVSGHTDLKNSIANKTILDKLQSDLPKAEFVFLDQLYPTFEINKEVEQQRLLNADIIVLQFPFFWYGVPSIMSRWMEETFVHGFSHGSTGDKLKDKKLIVSFTSGAPEEMYQKECDVRGQMVDRCQLYMYRMAVYYASSKNPDPKKLKWWIWKD